MTRRINLADLHDVARWMCSLRGVRWAALLATLLAASPARAEMRLSSIHSSCVGGSNDGETCGWAGGTNGCETCRQTADCPGAPANGGCCLCGITCGHRPGIYTATGTGGALNVSGLETFPFPAGGTMTLDVSLPDFNDCVAQTVIPYPGGFSAPVFCIPALGFTVSVVQTGCGIGLVDTDGGSDFTVTEVGDTSAPSAPCGLPHAGCTNGSDGDGRIDITVGDGTPDTCSGGGNGNAIVSVPVQTTTWLGALIACPDPDGTYDTGADALITSFPQILDFTTNTAGADFDDLDADGCYIAGSGPSSPQTATGSCVDLAGMDVEGPDVTVVASGPVFSTSSPLFDLSFKTVQAASYTFTGESSGASCASPPSIDFNGTAHRCVMAP